MFKVSHSNAVYKVLQAQVRYTHRTHYNVLKLQPNCSARDVRTAFIQLSKELHPDANVSNQAKYDKKSFVELLEAYKVLSKPESRAAYDYELSLSKNPGNQVFHSKSFTFQRDQLDEYSRQNAITHAEVREEAEKYGNKAQIERMKAKLNKEGMW
uniref:J domain-containing protein n=1 Tax=Anopheles coluzzii TaxID=1518534 RepID=A0A8W7NZ08_ANOCL